MRQRAKRVGVRTRLELDEEWCANCFADITRKTGWWRGVQVVYETCDCSKIIATPGA